VEEVEEVLQLKLTRSLLQELGQNQQTPRQSQFTALAAVVVAALEGFLLFHKIVTVAAAEDLEDSLLSHCPHRHLEKPRRSLSERVDFEDRVNLLTKQMAMPERAAGHLNLGQDLSNLLDHLAVVGVVEVPRRSEQRRAADLAS
jgi:hypothetical protein